MHTVGPWQNAKAELHMTHARSTAECAGIRARELALYLDVVLVRDGRGLHGCQAHCLHNEVCMPVCSALSVSQACEWPQALPTESAQASLSPALQEHGDSYRKSSSCLCCDHKRTHTPHKRINEARYHATHSPMTMKRRDRQLWPRSHWQAACTWQGGSAGASSRRCTRMRAALIQLGGAVWLVHLHLIRVLSALLQHMHEFTSFLNELTDS